MRGCVGLRRCTHWPDPVSRLPSQRTLGSAVERERSLSPVPVLDRPLDVASSWLMQQGVHHSLVPYVLMRAVGHLEGDRIDGIVSIRDLRQHTDREFAGLVVPGAFGADT